MILPCCCLLFATSVGAAETVLPTPVIRLTFESARQMSSAGNAQTTLEEYAPGEGPYLLPGPWGRHLDLSAASRFGGTIDQKAPAGGAVLAASPALNQLNSFTLSFWMRTSEATGENAARVLTKIGSWELMCNHGVPSLLVTDHDRKLAIRPSFPQPVRADDWMFYAVVVDSSKAHVQYFVGSPTSPLMASDVVDLPAPLTPTDRPLEIGNFQGIRPLRGLLDNLRIDNVPLATGQLEQVLAHDVAEMLPARSIHAHGVTAQDQRRFRPPASSIMFSTRWQRTDRGEFEIMDAFHASHCLWVYGSNPDFIHQVKQKVAFYEASLNGMWGYAASGPQPAAGNDSTGRVQDLDGNKSVMPHMQQWHGHPRWEGCHNNAAFRKIFFAAVDELVALDADAIHIDDWVMAVSATLAGRGCFCPACRAGFRDYLRQALSADKLQELGINDIDQFDYREFVKTQGQIENAIEYHKRYRQLPLTRYFIDFQYHGLRDFYRELRHHLDDVSPNKYIPVSVNQQFRRRGPDDTFGAGAKCVDLIDFYVGEPSQTMQTALDFVHPAKISEGFQIPQVMWSKPHQVGTALAAHATIYALGHWARVPWDLYMDNDPVTKQPAPRYFGTVKDWQPLYGFIYRNSSLFDQATPMATVGVVYNLDHAPYRATRSICAKLLDRNIPFQMISAGADVVRTPLDQQQLESFPLLINVCPDEFYCESDRAVLTAVRTNRRARILTPDADFERLAEQYALAPIRVEGPHNVFVFPRVKADRICVHVVNWNVRPDGAPDQFAQVTLDFDRRWNWAALQDVHYYAPEQNKRVTLQAEAHADIFRVTLPRLNTWAILEIDTNGSRCP